MLQKKIQTLCHFRKTRISCYGLAITIWLAAIFALSAQPTWTSSQAWMLITPIRKSAHALEFAVLTGLVWQALRYIEERSAWFGKMARYRTWTALLLPLLYAISDEMHQYFVPNRQAQVMDVLIDTVGIFLALAVIELLQKKQWSLAPQKLFLNS